MRFPSSPASPASPLPVIRLGCRRSCPWGSGSAKASPTPHEVACPRGSPGGICRPYLLHGNWHCSSCIAYARFDMEPVLAILSPFEPPESGRAWVWKLTSDLFTFIRYPGMEPTNNESECMLRKVMIYLKIRQKLVTIGGKIMFGIIMTCLLMWDKLGLNWFEKLSEVLWTT